MTSVREGGGESVKVTSGLSEEAVGQEHMLSDVKHRKADIMHKQSTCVKEPLVMVQMVRTQGDVSTDDPLKWPLKY